jgi:hypothetical protein
MAVYTMVVAFFGALARFMAVTPLSGAGAANGWYVCHRQ